MQNIPHTLAVTIDPNALGIPTVDASGSGAFNIIVGMIYTLIGALAIFYIIRAGLLYVTAGGDPTQIKEAKDTIIYALVAIAAASVVFVVIQTVIKGVSTGKII